MNIRRHWIGLFTQPQEVVPNIQDCGVVRIKGEF